MRRVRAASSILVGSHADDAPHEPRAYGSKFIGRHSHRATGAASGTPCSDALEPFAAAIRERGKEIDVSTATEVSTAIRPFHIDIPEEKLDDLRQRIGATRWPSKELVADRSQGVQLAALQALGPVLARRVRPRAGRGAPERAAAVRQRDRRRGHPLHPRQVAARERAAADHDPRLARLRDRAARLHRAADRPDRARRQRRGCLPSRAALPARVRALRASRPRSAGTSAGPRGPGPS